MKIKHIKTKEEFDEVIINSKKSAVVDFWAEWCGPCKMVAPVFEKVSNEIDDVLFIKVNVDEAQDLAGEYNIRSIPTMMFFKDSKVKDVSIGALQKDALFNFINKNK